MKDRWELVVGALGIGTSLRKPLLAPETGAGNRVLADPFSFLFLCLFFGFHVRSVPAGPVADVHVRSIGNRVDYHIVVAERDHFGFRGLHFSVGLLLLLAYSQMHFRSLEGVRVLKLRIVGFHKLIQEVGCGALLPGLGKSYFERFVVIFVFVLFIV